MGKKLDIDSMLIIDDSGLPTAPTVRQLLNKDMRTLYSRDKSPNKEQYIKECIVIYYLGDPKSPAKQAGLSDAEALRMAIEQADLPKDYIPDTLIISLIKQYYNENIGEAGRVVENILKGLHNINISIDAINTLLNEKLHTNLSIEDIATVLQLVDNVNKKAGELPGIVKKLEEAKQNLMYEKETEVSRGGGIVSSSMDADSYLD